MSTSTKLTISTPLLCSKSIDNQTINLQNTTVQMWWTNLSTKRLYFAMLKVKQWSSKFSKQSEFGLESASCKTPIFLSKPNWNWFGKSYPFFGCIFSKPNWIWFGKGHWMKCSCTALCTALGPFLINMFTYFVEKNTRFMLITLSFAVFLWRFEQENQKELKHPAD